MIHVIMPFLFGLSSSAGAVLVLDAQSWPEPHQTDVLLRRPDVTAFLRTLVARDGNRLVVRHAGGEQGAALAEDLESVLVAMGIESVRIRREPAAAGRGELVLEIVVQE